MSKRISLLTFVLLMLSLTLGASAPDFLQYPPARLGDTSVIYLVDRPDSKQATIQIGNRAINARNPDRYALAVVNTVLEGARPRASTPTCAKRHLFGFDPLTTDLRHRNTPPTWAAEAWPQFQQFSATCQAGGLGSCRWSMWGQILSDSLTGVRECLAAGPGKCHWMGTDQAGRGVLARGLYGGRISLRIGAYVAGISMTLGVVAGLISGYYAATLVDDVINAVIQTLGSIPLLFLLIILSRIFQPSPEGLALLLGVFSWMGISPLIRGQLFSIREREYIVASRALGATTWRIMFRHMLPNVASIVIVAGVFNIASAIIAEAGLSYLGVGIGPPLSSWGNMMQGSLGNFTDAPWLVLAPGLFIFLTTLYIYLIGDGLRDALDPWVKNP